MDDSGARRRPGRASPASVAALTTGVALCSLAGAGAPGTPDAVSSFAADEFVPDPETAGVLVAAGLVVAPARLSRGAALVAATTRTTKWLAGMRRRTGRMRRQQ